MSETVFRSVESEAEIVSEKDRILRFRVSDETPDRAGDIVRQGGIDWSRWEKNPVVLVAHDYEDFPVGKGVQHGRSSKGSWVDVKFATKDQYDRAEVAYQLAKPPDRFLNATSIGFIPTKVYSPETDEERKDLNLGSRGVVFEKAELLEVSLVAVPANPNALGLSVVKSAKEKFFDEWVERVPKTSVQTLIFSKDKYSTAESAKSWASKHGFRSDKVDETENSFRLRQFDPGECGEGTERTMDLTDGVKAVVCRKRGQESCEDPTGNTAATSWTLTSASSGNFANTIFVDAITNRLLTVEGPAILAKLAEIERRLDGLLTSEGFAKYIYENNHWLSPDVEEKAGAGRPGTVEPKVPPAVPPGADLYEQILGDLGRVAARAARKETDAP